jgi:chlorobactene glucosyltransferase
VTIVAAIIFVLWVFALARTFLNLTLVPRLAGGLQSGPLVSVIIPARNEARAIEKTVRSFCEQVYSPVEIIVVNDRSEDATGAIARGIAARDARVTVVDGVEPPAGWLGKPWALQQGADRAKGDLLLFVDADVRYAPAAVGAMVNYLGEEDLAMAAVFPNFEMEGFWERVTMPVLAFTAFAILDSWLSNRTRVAIFGIGGGCGNLIRREVYDRLGQHHSLSQSVIDDVALAHQVRRHGGRTGVARGEDLVSVRMYHGAREVVDGFTKNLFSALYRRYDVAIAAFLLVAVGNILPFILMIVAPLDGRISPAEWLGIGSVALIELIRIVLFRVMRYGYWNALLAHPLFIAFWLYVTVRSVWYTGVRRQVHWRGRTYDAARTRFGAE